MSSSRFLTKERVLKRSKYHVVAFGSGVVRKNIRLSKTAPSDTNGSVRTPSRVSNAMCHMPGTNCIVYAVGNNTDIFGSSLRVTKLNFSPPSTTTVHISEGIPTSTGRSILQVRPAGWSNDRTALLVRCESECRLYDIDTKLCSVGSKYSTFSLHKDTRTTDFVPSLFFQEMLTADSTGRVSLWDVVTSQIVQTFNEREQDRNTTGKQQHSTHLIEYTGHPRCAWCVGRGEQKVRLLDMRSSSTVGGSGSSESLRCTASGSKSLEGMGGMPMEISALHRDASAPFQCVIGSTHRVVVFDTRFTAFPVRTWHQSNMGTVHALHSRSLPSSNRKENGSIIIATSYDKCASTCLMRQPGDTSKYVDSSSSGACTFDPPYVVEHWRRVDSNVASFTKIVGIDVMSCNDVMMRGEEEEEEEEEMNDESNRNENSEEGDSDANDGEAGSEANDDREEKRHIEKNGFFFMSYLTSEGDVGVRPIKWSDNISSTMIDIVRQKRACGDTHTADVIDDTKSGARVVRSASSRKRKSVVNNDLLGVRRSRKVVTALELKRQGPRTMREYGLLPTDSVKFSSSSSSSSSSFSSSSSSSSALPLVRRHVIPANFGRPRSSRETLFENTRRSEESTSDGVMLFGVMIPRIPTEFSEARPNSTSRQVLSVIDWEQRRATHEEDVPAQREGEEEDQEEEEDNTTGSWLPTTSGRGTSFGSVALMKAAWQ